MALNKDKNTSPAFENPDDENVIENGADTTVAQTSALERAKQQAAEHAAAQAAAKEAETAPAESKVRDVAPAKSTAVAIPIAKLNPFPQLENQFPVTFQTFPNVKANQGQFLLDDKKLGDVIALELLSFQDQWMLAPGDPNDPNTKEWLRYSNDGETTTDGEDIHEVLRNAKAAGCDKAKIQKRLVIVGAVIDGGKDKTLEGKVVQIDLAPTSVGHFLAHQVNTAYAISKGKAVEGVNPLQVRLTAEPMSRKSLSWTEVKFEQFRG